MQMAKEQLQGKVSKQILHFQKSLVDIAAILEAWVDFPEEDLEFASMEEVVDHLSATKLVMEKLLNTFHDGKIAKPWQFPLPRRAAQCGKILPDECFVGKGQSHRH